MMDLDDIPELPDRNQRLEAILVDAYGQSEELTAFEVYINDTLDFPFSAEWRDPDEPDHSETVKVTGVSDVDNGAAFCWRSAGEGKIVGFRPNSFGLKGRMHAMKPSWMTTGIG